MTAAEFDALPAREADALIDEHVMGNVPDHGVYSGIYWGKLPCYSADLNACREFETKLLGMKLAAPPREAFASYDWFLERMLHYTVYASARQKCKAALMALGVIAASGKEDVG